MPTKGVLCDDPEHEGEQYSFEECIGCALRGGPRRCHNPVSLMVAMSRNDVERKDAGISATMLLGCPRKVILQEEYDFYEHPSDYWARFRGTMGHLMMEHYAPENVEGLIMEVRYRKVIEVDGVPFEITGKPDFVNTNRGLIIDYKTTADIEKYPMSTGRPKQGHEEQVNIYRWLLAGGTNMETGTVEHHDITAAGIIYMDMGGTKKVGVDVWTGDHYARAVGVAIGNTEGKPRKKQVDVDLWPVAQAEAFIRAKLRPFVAHKETGELPPLLTTKSGARSRLCDYCAVRDICDRLWEEEHTDE